jgi:CDGSH iron-sulfur domain-containing protein 3
MENPVIAQRSPYAIELAAGDHWWCACGRSTTQPFCDGSHKGTGITPMKFSVDKTEKLWLCGCKGSGNKPFCDGAHKKLAE